MTTRLLTYLFLMILLAACSSKDPEIENPFDKTVELEEHTQVNGDTVDIEDKTIQYLHAKIFKPTCANSGCHDGNFEPDFRTIESSYNTIVNQPIIKNDEMNPLQIRVSPNNADISMLIRRMEIDLNGNSGIMPLSLESDSDWPQKKLQYIQDVKDWINNGALDQNGEARGNIDFPPQLLGVMAVSGGSEMPRAGRQDPIPVPSSGTIELWFSFTDDITDVSMLTGGKLNGSLQADSFDVNTEISISYTSNTRTSAGFSGDDVEYNYKTTFNLNNWASGDVVWLRTKISDGTHQVELPNNNSLFNAKKYAAVRLN